MSHAHCASLTRGIAMRFLLAVLIFGATPVWAAAQTTPATLPANDATIAIGWAGSDHEVREQQQWHGSLLVAVSGGHYWTDHLKTEVDASWNGQEQGDVFETSSVRAATRLRSGIIARTTYALEFRSSTSSAATRGSTLTLAQAPTLSSASLRSIALPSREPCFFRTGSLPVTIAAATERKTHGLRSCSHQERTEDVRHRKGLLQHRAQGRPETRRRSSGVETWNGR